MSSMRRGVVVAMLCVAQIVSAQIRIIPQAQLEAATPQAQSSTLQFVPREVDFGTIEEMSGVWQGSANLVNIGTDTLALTQIKTTCGCLKAEVQKRVLAPNESVAVALKYYPRGHAGRVSQRVLLYTNGATETPSAILTLRGLVTASEDRSDDYPYSRGVLRLRQEVVQLQGETREVLRVACMNGGSIKLRPVADAMLLPKGVKVYFEPAELAPKQQGDMVVEYVPQGEIATADSFKIYIKGLNLPPRQSVVEVVVGKQRRE
ncbi:MAG: DUF1573 domain-containing protein [Rikenellaceae bacterium]|nr:DUF1573 domain-containing protein [Rikenellaceae bacterium]